MKGKRIAFLLDLSPGFMSSSVPLPFIYIKSSKGFRPDLPLGTRQHDEDSLAWMPDEYETVLIIGISLLQSLSGVIFP